MHNHGAQEITCHGSAARRALERIRPKFPVKSIEFSESAPAINYTSQSNPPPCFFKFEKRHTPFHPWPHSPVSLILLFCLANVGLHVKKTQLINKSSKILDILSGFADQSEPHRLCFWNLAFV